MGSVDDPIKAVEVLLHLNPRKAGAGEDLGDDFGLRRADFDEILADIERRDERDMGRADSPLKPASDAHLLDTTEMSIEAAFRAARAIVDGVVARRSEA